MSGLLPPPTGAGGGGEASSSNVKPSESGAGSPFKTRKSSDRKMVFGTPTSQLSSTTDLPSQAKPDEHRPNAGAYLGMSPVRDSVGNLLQQQQPLGEGTRLSEDVQQYSTPAQGNTQPDGREVEGRTRHRWNSARSKLGNVLSVRHNIRDTLSSRGRQNSAMPKVDHLMNELNSREALSRDNLNGSSSQGTGHQSPPPPHPTAATSLAGTIPHHLPEGSSGNSPKYSSPSRFSNKLASWRHHHHHHRKGRGRESLEEEREGVDISAPAEQLRSSSSPPTQRFRTRVNRFLRSGKHPASSTASPASSAAAAAGSEPGHLESLSTRTPAHTPPYISSGQSSTVRESSHGSGFREAVRRGVASARRRVSVPFLSIPLAYNDVSGTGAIETEPPERPQTVPLERRDANSGPWVGPGGSDFALNSKPGHDFLPSEATNVVPNYAAPPKATENPAPEEWRETDFEQAPMIQSPPPLNPPGMEESPPISPWIKVSTDETKEWLRLTSEPPILPEIGSIAPFAVGEMMDREYDMTKKRSSGGQNLSDIYWAVEQGTGTGRIDEGQAIDKGKGKAAISNTDHLELPENSRYFLGTSGKSIEVLEEEKRRKSRDTGIMGLDPEVNHRSDAPSGSGSRVEDEDGEFTYASAMREIAGLDRFPKRPSHDDDANLDDVSVPECDYDFPLPSFRFSMLAEPSPSSNEPDASPCTASSSSTQQPSGSTPTFSRLASTHMQAATTTITSTATTTRTTTASSTNPSASSSVSPPNIPPCQCQMLLSSKRPYLFVLQELSSGTYVKITPQSSSSPVSRSMSSVSRSYPETPAASQTSPGGPAISPVSVRFLNSNGLLPCNADEDEDSEDEEVQSGGRVGIQK